MSNLAIRLKESWALVEDQQDKIAQYFYARMFLHNSRVRDMFPIEMNVQRARLLGAIVTVLQSYEDPDRTDDYLSALGRDHRKYSVEESHYELVGTALVEALRTFADERWSPAYEQAWRDAYAMISHKMMAGADGDTNPPFWAAEVVAHERRSSDVAVLRLRTSEPLPYRAGQYVSVESLRLPRVWRVYSIANAPRPDNTIDLHVRSLGAGWLSGVLVRRTQVGDTLRVAAPMGQMSVEPGSQNDLVCVAGGTGLAPIKAIIEDLGRYNRTRWVHLFYGARNEDDLYDLKDLQVMAERYPWLTLTPVLTDPPSGWSGARGTVADVMADRGPWEDHHVLVSGSEAMVRYTLRRLAQMKVPSVRISYDTFGEQ
ncbi:MAG TPA: FAD-binding oxidoreductase [Micromonosporaceae bacterium]|jgi:NAD(P)H-flavin reductase